MTRNPASIIVILSLLIGMAAKAKGDQLRIIINQDDIDLTGRTINFRLNKPAQVAEIKVYDLDGNVISERVKTYDGARPGTKLSISWPRITGDPDNFKIELKATDVNDFWVGFEIVRFFGEIPHQEVIFESGKDVIRPDQAPKLDEVIPKIAEMVKKFQRFSTSLSYSLYVAGHTDTVGSIADNRELSRKRANAIARYFLSHGLGKMKLSVFVRGFGEEALAVQTGDNTPEERNRRADYIISNFPPSMPGPGSWKKIR